MVYWYTERGKALISEGNYKYSIAGVNTMRSAVRSEPTAGYEYISRSSDISKIEIWYFDNRITAFSFLSPARVKSRDKLPSLWTGVLFAIWLNLNPETKIQSLRYSMLHIHNPLFLKRTKLKQSYTAHILFSKLVTTSIICTEQHHKARRLAVMSQEARISEIPKKKLWLTCLSTNTLAFSIIQRRLAYEIYW